ncbi:uncharacterized protein ATNIH1004_000024 [Aspergillus tanneri]|uniref:Uncharacterized protein n=1 Tax=Aspergillus tanneri TaxID=1220188 RepID=A0A5M9MYU5_9EURO|nr:uncharacterized protein ATNIH1004_000024 [Aspergillus tanneri]KAA8651146.1 hypothetical protein ATNIH1004_000024 [Aspergillus tanneri]
MPLLSSWHQVERIRVDAVANMAMKSNKTQSHESAAPLWREEDAICVSSVLRLSESWNQWHQLTLLVRPKIPNVSHARCSRVYSPSLLRQGSRTPISKRPMAILFLIVAVRKGVATHFDIRTACTTMSWIPLGHSVRRTSTTTLATCSGKRSKRMPSSPSGRSGCT